MHKTLYGQQLVPCSGLPEVWVWYDSPSGVVCVADCCGLLVGLCLVGREPDIAELERGERYLEYSDVYEILVARFEELIAVLLRLKSCGV